MELAKGFLHGFEQLKRARKEMVEHGNSKGKEDENLQREPEDVETEQLEEWYGC
jgi:hypothetical protein